MGVAPDPTGFQETAPVFINILSKYTPAIYYLRVTQGSRYPSILKLFNVWHQRVFDFEVAWKRVLDTKNRQLVAEGRPTISRFHATYWSTQREEFKGWSDDEKFELFDKLLGVFYRYPVGRMR